MTVEARQARPRTWFQPVQHIEQAGRQVFRRRSTLAGRGDGGDKRTQGFDLRFREVGEAMGCSEDAARRSESTCSAEGLGSRSHESPSTARPTMPRLAQWWMPWSSSATPP